MLCNHNITKGIVDKYMRRTANSELGNIKKALISGETISGCQTLLANSILAKKNGLEGQ